MRKVRSLVFIATAGALFSAGAVQAACDATCGAIKQIMGARASGFAQFKGKQEGDGLWESNFAPPGLFCQIMDHGSGGGAQMSCSLRGTSGVDYTDAQADQSFAALSAGVRASEPGFKWFRVTKFDTPALHAPNIPASVSIVASMRDDAGDVMLYVGPAAHDYALTLSLSKMAGHSAEIQINSKDSDTGYPLEPYAPK